MQLKKTLKTIGARTHPCFTTFLISKVSTTLPPERSRSVMPSCKSQIIVTNFGGYLLFNATHWNVLKHCKYVIGEILINHLNIESWTYALKDCIDYRQLFFDHFKSLGQFYENIVKWHGLLDIIFLELSQGKIYVDLSEVALCLISVNDWELADL